MRKVEPNAPAEISLFRTIIETAVDGILVIDQAGRIQICNPAVETLFGYRAEEVLGQNIRLLMPAPFQSEHDAYLENYKRTGEKKIIGIGREVAGQRKDGTVFPMYLSVGEGHLAGGKVFVGIIRDLTALKSESALREDANRHLAQIVKSSNDAIISKTLVGTITSWNAAAEHIFGYGADEMVGNNISLLIPPDRLDEEENILQMLKAGREIENYETIRRRKDGGELHVSISVSPLRDSFGAIVGASKTARDITKQKQNEKRMDALQSELAHVARLSAMGQMTAAIAHELNQPLTAFSNYVSAARRTLAPLMAAEPNEALSRAQDMIEKAANQSLRAGGIIRNLRDFVEKRESDRRPENLNAIVQEAVLLGTVGTADSGVKLRLDLDAMLPPVLIDKIQIQQVLLNLIRNSVEAMSNAETRELTLTTSRDDADFALVTVADTGSGLPPEVAARLFQPFITTKEKGMGIGLTICRSIVDDHGGRIWTLPGNSNGTAFHIRLPFARAVEVAS